MIKKHGFIYTIYSKNYNKNSWYKEFIVSYESLKRHIPNSNVSVYTNISENQWPTDVNVILDKNMKHTHISKAYALLKSPYEKTIFLDTDVLVHQESLTAIFRVLGDEYIFASAYDRIWGNLTNNHFNTGIIGVKKCESSQVYLNQWIRDFEEKNQPFGLDQLTFKKLATDCRAEGKFFILGPELQLRPLILINQIKNPITTHFRSKSNGSICHKEAVKSLLEEIKDYYDGLK